MNMKKSTRNSRLPLAITLIIAAFASALVIATYSNKGSDYWVIAAAVNPGHVITSSDIQPQHLNLTNSSDLYFAKGQEVIGMVVTRKMNPGEVIGLSDVTTTENAMATSAVPLSVRTVDMAKGVNIGEGVDIYWVMDSRNGEAVVDPILILGGVTLLSFEEKNLGGEVGLTVAIEETQVLRLLSATTQGRLVVVRSHV